MQKPIITLIMPLSFNLLTNDYFQVDFLNKLYIYEQVLDVNQNLFARAVQNTFSASSDFFLPSTSNNQGISCFYESNCTCLCYFCRCALFSVD